MIIDCKYLAGKESGCPYCLAAEDAFANVGTRLFFLSGESVGQYGEVVDGRHIRRPDHTILVSMDFAPSDTLCVVGPRSDLYIDCDRFAVPDWMPSLSVEDNAKLHAALPSSLGEFWVELKHQTQFDAIRKLVGTVWWNRLPLAEDELWNLLLAHGAPAEIKSDFLKLYRFGMALLIGGHGRRPVKRRRMPPMSQGRYLTKSAREIWIRALGHD